MTTSECFAFLISISWQVKFGLPRSWVSKCDHLPLPCVCLFCLKFPGQPGSRSLWVVAMANSKQAGSSSRMTMDEYKQLSNLLRRASNEKRLGEVMVFANVEEEAASQLQTYLHPAAGAKAKPKAKAVSQAVMVSFLWQLALVGQWPMRQNVGWKMIWQAWLRLKDGKTSKWSVLLLHMDMLPRRRLKSLFQVKLHPLIWLQLMFREFRGILLFLMMIWMVGTTSLQHWILQRDGQAPFASCPNGSLMNGPMSI